MNTNKANIRKEATAILIIWILILGNLVSCLPSEPEAMKTDIPEPNFIIVSPYTNSNYQYKVFLSNEKPTTLITKNQPPQQFEC